MLAVTALVVVVTLAVAWLLRGEVLYWVERLIAGAAGETVLALPSVIPLAWHTSPCSLDEVIVIPEWTLSTLHIGTAAP